MISIDEISKKLDTLTNEQLGQLYCDMNAWKWPENILGKKPETYDQKTPKECYRLTRFLFFNMIEPRLSEEDRSFYWWTKVLKRTEEAWEEWYFNESR